MGEGGEIFVLDMGQPIKIQYLAEQMIFLSGKKLGVDIDILYCGLRPGEKLYEELFYSSEQQGKTDHEKIFLAQHSPISADFCASKINDLIADELDCKNQDLTLTMVQFLEALERHSRTGGKVISIGQ